MEKKMDMNDSTSIWIQSLGVLFMACEQLTYDCYLSENEYKTLIKEIEHKTYYCADVKEDIENGRTPKTWDEWNKSDVEEVSVGIDPVNSREFGDILTKIYNYVD